MLGDTVNIDNLCCNSSNSSEKKGCKTSKMLFFLDPIYIEKGTLWATPKIEKKFHFQWPKTAAPLGKSAKFCDTPLESNSSDLTY